MGLAGSVGDLTSVMSAFPLARMCVRECRAQGCGSPLATANSPWLSVELSPFIRKPVLLTSMPMCSLSPFSRAAPRSQLGQSRDHQGPVCGV